MKKLKSFALILLAFITSASCFACGGQEVPPPAEPEEVALTAEAVYAKLKTSMSGTISQIYSSESFTAWKDTPAFNVDSFVLNEEKTNLGSTDESGEPWTEETKAAAINAYKENFPMTNVDATYYKKVSYDGVNETGYEEYDNGTIKNYLFQKEGDGYAVYSYAKAANTVTSKYVAGAEYDYQLRQTAANEIFNEYSSVTEYDTLAKLLEEIAGDDPENAIEPAVTFSENDGVYTFKIEFSQTTPIAEDDFYNNFNSIGIGTFTETVYSTSLEIVFNDSFVQSVHDAYSLTSEGVKKINDSPDSGSFVVDYTYSYDCAVGFKPEYDGDDRPDFGSLEDYDDCGNLNIFVNYFFGDYKISGSNYMRVYGREFQPFAELDPKDLNTDKIRDDVVWYIDDACTVPFTSSTYPSHDLNLRTKDYNVCKEGYAIAVYDSFDSEEEYLEAMANGEPLWLNRCYITPTAYEIDEYCDCVYINGTRYDKTSGEISLTYGVLNVIVKIG